jgi:hypothetical protein
MELRSLRLTFRYDAHGLRLFSRTPRGSLARPSEPLTEPPPGAITLELRSRTGEVRYRRFLIDPITQTLETLDDLGRLRRIPFAPPSGSFSAVAIPRHRTMSSSCLRGPRCASRSRRSSRTQGRRLGVSFLLRVQSVPDDHGRWHRACEQR